MNKLDQKMQIKEPAASPSSSILLSLAISLQAVSIAPVGAQVNGYGYSSPGQAIPSNQGEMLPPEVIPVNGVQANRAYSPQLQTNGGTVPGLVGNSIPNVNPNMLTPNTAQGYKQALMNTLMGQGNYPQFQGQQSGNNFNNAAQAFSPSAPGSNSAPGAPQSNGGNAQTLSQSDWVTPNQQNQAQGNPTPAQTQTLSGGVQNQQASQSTRQGAGYSHKFSSLLGFGMSALGLGMGLRGGGTSGLYPLGVAGGGMMNNGMNNGFRF
jgi:hypothetical protein